MLFLVCQYVQYKYRLYPEFSLYVSDNNIIFKSTDSLNLPIQTLKHFKSSIYTSFKA